VIVEVKAVENVLPIHIAQLISYLNLSRRRIGLLLNFNVERFKDAIHRKVWGTNRYARRGAAKRRGRGTIERGRMTILR